jgi:hypothetical protein
MQLRPHCKHIFLVTLCSLHACATNKVTQQAALDFSSAGSIELQVSAQDPALSLATIEQEVSSNLAGWDYPLGKADGKTVTHQLKASVGAISHGSSPTGLSFSAGNSDPRALEFQKMDVLPVTCRLESKAHPEQVGELSMDFKAEQEGLDFLAADKLSDHISTVCYNLLTDLQWPKEVATNDAKKTTKSPSWIPEIRIGNKEYTDSNGETLTPATPPAEPTKESITKEAGKDEPVTLEQQSSEAKQPRKQIIIHNQGSPVILDFGYERR